MKFLDIVTQAQICIDCYTITAHPDRLAKRYRQKTGKRIRTTTVARAIEEWRAYERSDPGILGCIIPASVFK